MVTTEMNQPTPLKATKSNYKDIYGLAQSVINNMGGAHALLQRKDVSYELTQHHIATGKKDISIEKYIFGENYSSGDYYLHNWKVFPTIKDPIHQFSHEGEAHLIIKDKLIVNNIQLEETLQTRVDNLFEFSFPFQITDSKFILENMGKRKVNNISYNLIKLSFKPDYVPENHSVFILYINPRTHLIDQYLFSKPQEGLLEPRILVKLNYKELNNIMFPVKREFYQADSKGNIISELVEVHSYSNLQFDNGFQLIN